MAPKFIFFYFNIHSKYESNNTSQAKIEFRPQSVPYNYLYILSKNITLFLVKSDEKVKKVKTCDLFISKAIYVHQKAEIFHH